MAALREDGRWATDLAGDPGSLRVLRPSGSSIEQSPVVVDAMASNMHHPKLIVRSVAELARRAGFKTSIVCHRDAQSTQRM